MDLSNSHLNLLENTEQFAVLDGSIKEVVIKHFFDFKSDFRNVITEKVIYGVNEVYVNELKVIQCRKCLNAPLVDQSINGMIEHYLAHTLDNLTKLGLYKKRPLSLFLGG